jgi:biopolymer transport protein ExbD
MRFPHNVRVFRGQFDAAPFAGVFLLLLLFVLFSSSLVYIPGVPIRLPETPPLPGPNTATVVVAVDRGGLFYFENQICDAARLRTKLASAVSHSAPPPTLVVQADRDVRCEVLVRLSLLAREAGVKNALLATRPQAIPAPAVSRP